MAEATTITQPSSEPFTELCLEIQDWGSKRRCMLPKGHTGMHTAGGVLWRAFASKEQTVRPMVTKLQAYLNRIEGKAYEQKGLDLLKRDPNWGLTSKHPEWQNISDPQTDLFAPVVHGKCGVDGCTLAPGHAETGFISHWKPGTGYFTKENGVAKTERNYTYLQGILRSGISLARVIEQYKLRVTRSKRHNNLVQFKYDQIESNLSDPLVQQCRGIIMDENDNWRIVARPLDKFFNYGEAEAADIDWKTARVVEKLDGTCCILYYYDGWHVATLGSCDASGEVHGFPGMTYASLFWDTFKAKKYKAPDAAWQDVTFIFELTTPHNRVVVPHAFADLRLLATRVADGSESSILGLQDGKSHGFATPKTFALTNLKEIQDSFAVMNPLNQEGYVVVDGKYRRIKVKHPGYVRLHHMKDAFTFKNVVEMVRNGETPELLAYFPEHEPLVTMVRDSFFDLVDRISMTWVSAFKVTDYKEFAHHLTADGVMIKDLPYSGVLFALRRSKVDNVLVALKQMNIDHLISMLEVERPKV